MRVKFNKMSILAVITSLALYSGSIFAADHAEAPLVESDQAADIADVYAFLDPNDNSKVILAFDVHGFIVPGENGNLGGFDHDVRYRFNIENTGDAKPDKYINVSFSAQTSRSQPQTATVTIPAKKGLIQSASRRRPPYLLPLRILHRHRLLRRTAHPAFRFLPD